MDKVALSEAEHRLMNMVPHKVPFCPVLLYMSETEVELLMKMIQYVHDN